MSAPGVAAYGVTTLGIGTAALLTGDALADTAAMRWAEYVGGAAARDAAKRYVFIYSHVEESSGAASCLFFIQGGTRLGFGFSSGSGSGG